MWWTIAGSARKCFQYMQMWQLPFVFENLKILVIFIALLWKSRLFDWE